MPINYDNLTPNQQIEVANIIQAVEACEGKLADVQTTRAQQEALWNGQENKIIAERDKLKVLLRAIRNIIVT